MNGKNDLTQEQKIVVKSFEIAGGAATDLEAVGNEKANLTYAQRVLKKHKRNVETDTTPNSNYENIDWIPATNSVVERAFSRAGIVLSDLRLRMTPFHFECVMMLYMNKKYWSIATVTAAIANATESDDDTEENNYLVNNNT